METISNTKYPKKAQTSSSKKNKLQNKKVITNYYQVKLINSKTNKKLYILSWAISLGGDVPLDARNTYQKYIQLYRPQIKSKIGFFLFSGQKIYSIGDPNTLEKHNFKFTLANEEEPELTMNLNKDVYDLSHPSKDPIKNGEVTKVLNLIMKSNMQRLGYQELGYNKKYYDNKPHEVTLGDWSFLILKGIKSSINIVENGIMINLDYNLRITRYYNLWEESEFLRQSGQRMDDIIENNVIGKSFILLHANHRLISVNEVDRKMKITDAFPNKKYKNYIDYFQKKYNYQLDDKNQFFCVSIQKQYKFPANTNKNLIKRDRRNREYIEQHNYFPSQTLRPTGMLDEQKRNHKSMREFSKYTKLFPDQRMDKIEHFIQRNNKLDPNKKNIQNKRAIDLGKDIKLVIEETENTVNGRIISYPQIKSGNGDMKPNPKNGNYVMKNNIYEKGFVLRNYALVYDRFQSKNVDKVINGLTKCSKAYGVKVKKPSVMLEIDSRNVDPHKLLNRIQEDEDIDLVLFVVGSRNRIYDVIKNYFAKNEIATQFFTNIGFKTNLSVYSKVLLQQVAKLDGVLWHVEDAFEDKSEFNCLMGFDIVHSRKGLIVSLVYSVDKKFTKFWSFADVVKSSTKKNTRLLIAEKISDLFVQACEQFQVRNNRNPSNIVVYRIGSGNSSGLDEDLRYEAMLCESKLKEIMAHGKESKIVYFAVSRQINERIFDLVSGNKARNPRGGLIVHEGIVRQNRFEFFMVAQNVNQGSAMPTKYSCVFNSSKLNQEEIYKTTYYQTFNYPNWQGPVKVPGVAMNALKLSQYWADNVKNRKNQLQKCVSSTSMYYL